MSANCFLFSTLVSSARFVSNCAFVSFSSLYETWLVGTISMNSSSTIASIWPFHISLNGIFSINFPESIYCKIISYVLSHHNLNSPYFALFRFDYYNMYTICIQLMQFLYLSDHIPISLEDPAHLTQIPLLTSHLKQDHLEVKCLLHKI